MGVGLVPAPPYVLTSLRRGAVGFGRAFRPAIKPLAYGAAGVLAFRGVTSAVEAYGYARNPPAQKIPIDVDGQPGAESFGVFDTRTGRLVTFGLPPTSQGDDDRSDERIIKTVILAGVAIGGAVLVSVLLRK